MNPQHQLQLEDAQKKLALFRKHLDLLARCTGESKNVEKDEILSAVAELQSLVEWASQQPDLGAVSAVLLVKLQELHQIRENLEKESLKVSEHSISEINDEKEVTVSEKSEDFSKNVECISNVIEETLCGNNGENVEEDSVSIDKDSLCDNSISTEDRNIANAESPQSIEDTNYEIIPTDDKSDEVINIEVKGESETINEQIIALNYEEISHENAEIPQASSEIKDVLDLESKTPEIRSPDLYRSEVIIIETDEDNKSTEWVNDSQNSSDPLDVCMFAIRNLYESLKVKENELLKLSTLQTDQKHIEALQAVIIDFHRDITNLNSELDISRKENLLLKEQVLELEEAENDARLEAQKLEQKLVFLQEKDSHSQAELSQLKQSLKKSAETLAEKEVLEKELRSEIKYMETLVQKYEDQIKNIETKETEAFQKAVENKLEPQKSNDYNNQDKRLTSNKGTQTYPQSRTKINSISGVANNNSDNNNNDTNNNNENQILNVYEVLDISEDCKEMACEMKIQDSNSSIYSLPSTSLNETTESTEQADIVNIENIENISQKGLLKRLHKLIDEDVSLQQQIHYVDEINLALWKKLQNLDNHIGECKRQNINETNLINTETELKESICDSANVEIQPNNNSTNENIPHESLSCLVQNEQYIQERLLRLEEINASFEKELKTRENICKEKEKKYEEWMETEKRVMDDLNRLAEEKNWVTSQVNNLQKEIEVREKLIIKREQDLITLKMKNQEEIVKIRADQGKMIEPFISKINEMLTKEKDILRMITNLKSKENRSQGELERLKCNYIELQLELSQAREEIRKVEEKFKILLDHCASKHLSEESHHNSELERLRCENGRCNKMLSNLQKNEKDLINALEKQEMYLQDVRENFKKNLEETEEEHRFVETELESQLRQIEEGTVIATNVLKEERKKVEKELQENIEDLKAKEEVYKARIAELERDVIHLHEELHKMTDDSDVKDDGQLQERSPDEVMLENVDISSAKTENLRSASENVPQTEIEFNGNSSKELGNEKTPVIAKQKNVNSKEKENDIVKETPEENVDELRAQVRELQSHIEKISEVAELPPVQPPKPITASSLKMQTVEDLDYAEVEECCLDAWKKKNESTSAGNGTKLEAYYKEKYPEEYNDEFKNRREPKESEEDNDYDEVLPRPTNFHVVQQVGADTLLVGWNYVNPSVLDGFEILLDNQVHERIYIPDRTKALISGLNLRKPISLSICALSRYGQMSEPAVLDISTQRDLNTFFFDDEEDEYRDFEDPTKEKQRPYSMEW